MLSLTVKQNDATIVVRWCVDEKTLDSKYQQYIILNVQHENKMLPMIKIYAIDQCMAYLPAYSPGKHTITGYVVTATDNSLDAINRAFLCDRFSMKPLISNFSYSIELYDSVYKVNIGSSSLPHTVYIDEHYFGKSFPKKLQKYLNLYWYDSDPVDECEQRRRVVLFPFTTLPVLIAQFFGSILLRSALALLNLSVYSTPNLKSIARPLTPMQFDRGKSLASYILKNYPDFKEFIGIVFLASPFYYSILFLLLHDKIGDKAWCYVLVLQLIMIIMFLAMASTLYFFKHLIRQFKSKADTVKKTEHKTNLLICSDQFEPEPLKLSDKKLTVLMAEIKSKVCKPISQ